jgi:polysaccharide biosynthesis transport protein
MHYPTVPAPSPPASELNIREHLDVLRRRRDVFALVFIAALAVGVIAAVRASKPVYQAHAKILVSAASASVSVVDANNPIGGMLAAAQPDSVSTQLQVLESAPFQAEAWREAGIQKRPQVRPPVPSVEQLEGTNVIQITVTGGDPNDCAKLANAIVSLHLERTDLLRTTGLKDTIQFVRKETDKAADRLTDMEQQILQFRQDHKGLDLTTERETRSGEYTALLARVLDLDSSVKTTRTQIGSLRARLGQEPAELTEEQTKENPRALKLREKLDELALQRSDLLREYRPTSRPVQDLERQMRRLQRQMDAEPKVNRVRTYQPNPARAQLKTRLEELEAALQGHEENHRTALAQFTAKKGLLESMGPWEAELTRLTRDRDAAQAAHAQMAERLRDLEIRAGARMRTARALERAKVPGAPLPSQKSKNIIMAVVLALMLAVSTVFLQEFMDDRVNSPEELERVTPLRTLARVPLMPADQSRMMSALPVNSLAAEAYRALRASIGFASIDAPIRRLQITSSSPGEGKSTTAVNLATAMARDGKRVVLVDADLRSPSLHRMLQVESSPGLSEVLVGMKSVEDALRPTGVENLLVLPTGPIPPNPAELLGSPRFAHLLEQLDGAADIVIVDTPPCVPVTDPVIIAARMDAVVMVLKVGETRKGAVKQTMEQLEQARARVVGIVFNQIQPHGSAYYSYPYGQNGQNGHTNRRKVHGSNGKAPQHALVGNKTEQLGPREEKERDAA